MPVNGSPISTGAVGYYANQSDLEDRYGSQNVAAWSNPDSAAPGSPAVTARIQKELTYADSVINAFFAGKKYLTPMVLGVISKPVVTRWAVVIAGTSLYNNRGQNTSGKGQNQYTAELAKVMAEMLDAREGPRYTLSDATRINGSVPFVGGFDPQTNQLVSPANQGSRWYGNLIGWG